MEENEIPLKQHPEQEVRGAADQDEAAFFRTVIEQLNISDSDARAREIRRIQWQTRFADQSFDWS